LSGVTTDLLTGLAQRATTATIGPKWSPAGTYAASDIGIFLKIQPVAPDRCITLAAVDQGDDILLPFGQKMVQVRARGAANNPMDCDDILDSIKAVFHGSLDLTFGTAHVITMMRRLRVPMGMDESKRWDAVDQYYLDVDSPATALQPTYGP
jgi:hypothetical protein